ncbi:MAG TPA: ACT domain-containing protein, partial [Bacillales bacterium]|nr:ACT domain-containing protein [Bacillales bacterium]
MTTRLLISCPDRPGIVAEVSQFLFEREANIVESDQYSTDPSGGTFFMRIAFEIADESGLEKAFAEVARTFSIAYRFS